MSTNEEQQSAHESNYSAMVKYEATVYARASQLTKGWDPHCNITPILDLIRKADNYGFTIHKQPEKSAFK